MADRRNGTLVYSTDAGRICAGCGWPARDCTCSKTPDQRVPSRIVAKLRMEKKGRGGKTITVVDGLPRNVAFLKDLWGNNLRRRTGRLEQRAQVIG
jgi:translation initiation factor 1